MEGGNDSRLPSATAWSSTPIETLTCKDIPLIDFSLLINGTPNQRTQSIQDIGKACKEWGCFSVVNHGVPESLRTSMVDALRDFLDLPVEDRREFMGKYIFDPIRHEAGLAMTVDGEYYWREYVRIFVHPILHTPSKPLHFRTTCEEYGRQTRDISIKLLNAIGESLGLEESYMEKTLNLANGLQVMAGNRYPQSQLSVLGLGLASHSDTPLLSLVMQNGSTHGLQILHDERWISVELMRGSFFVHTGDLLEIVSNGIYKSLLHRVELNQRSQRMSIVTALGTPKDYVLSPAPKLVELSGNMPAFRSIKYMEFVELTKRNQFLKAGLSLIKA